MPIYKTHSSTYAFDTFNTDYVCATEVNVSQTAEFTSISEERAKNRDL